MGTSTSGTEGLGCLSECIKYIRENVSNNVHMPLIEVFLAVAMNEIGGNKNGMTKTAMAEAVGRPQGSVNKHASLVHLSLGLIEPREDEELILGRRYRFFLTPKGRSVAQGLESIVEKGLAQ